MVEAGWQLGDRLLKLEAPHVRGDDVAALQAALNHLGFDCGRPDGIFGRDTSRALLDFQRNGGLIEDGICGANTVRMITLLGRQSGQGPGVASVRETLTMPTSDEALRVVVGQFGGLSSISRSVTRALRERGATVISTDELDAAAQAAAANRFGASVYVGFEAGTNRSSMISYFAVPTFESLGGRALATLMAGSWAVTGLAEPEVRGMRLAVLRETKMPAVLCSLSPVRQIVDANDLVTSAVVDALTTWATNPVG